MHRSHTLLIILTVSIFLLIFGFSAAAEPDQDSWVYLPYVARSNPPVDYYATDFKEGMVPWQMVRWQHDDGYDSWWEEGCIGRHCGFLNLLVSKAHSYAIVSPLIEGPTRSYVLTFRARLSDRKDKHQYGAIFSADADEVCPGHNTNNCFNRYYQFRARFRKENGQEWMEYRLRRIDGHDQNKIEYGEDLMPWTRAEGVKVDDWIKWEIRFRASGHIYVRANNRDQPGYARDNKHLYQRYFGLTTRTSEKGKAFAQFDLFEISVDP